MAITLQDLFNLNLFSTGRRIFALQQVIKKARELGFERLVALIERAIARDRATFALEKDWRRQRVGLAPKPPRVRPIDLAIDRTLSAIYGVAKKTAKGADPADPIVAAIDAFLRELFPTGLAGVVNLEVIEELPAVELILERLKGDLKPTADALGIGRLVDRLEALVGQYRTVIESPAPDALAFGDIRTARAAGQDLLLQVVAVALGEYHDSENPEHVAAREALLAPVLEQNAIIRQYVSARRAVQDVDPDTGEVDDDGEGPPPGGGTT